MKITHLDGLIAAPFTPMRVDGSVNSAAIGGYYRFLKHNGIAGAFICGSTGEGASMSSEEKKMVIKGWADVTRGDRDFKVMALVGGTSLEDCKTVARFAEKSGLHAVSFTAPFYFKPRNVEALAACCQEVAGVVPDMPFYYYHIPVLTGVDFPMIELLKNVEGKIANFAGIKYTHEDFMDFLTCLHFAGQKFDMLWGRDENMLPALAVGAKGFVGSTFNYAAPLYRDLTLAFEKGDMRLAQILQQRANDMISLLGKYGGIATGKTFMKMVGIDCGEFRLPVKNMSELSFELFKNELKERDFKSYCSMQPVEENT